MVSDDAGMTRSLGPRNGLATTRCSQPAALSDRTIGLIGRLPREVFIAGWTALLAAVALWLARPWPVALLVLALPVSQEVMIGNIHLLLAAAIVLGFRWPATWAFVLLTKVTPGVGLLWFLVRREWRSLAIALAMAVGIAGVSYVLAPSPWADWLRL